METDRGRERAKGIQRTHEIAARLQQAAKTGDEPAAGGQEGDQFDGGEADSLEEIQKVQQGCVGFVRGKCRREFWHYFNKTAVLIWVPKRLLLETILYCGKARKVQGFGLVIQE